MQFLWHRVLRIFPAFWAALLLGALVVGPAVWWRQGRPLSDYWTTAPGGPLTYLTANWHLEISQYGIHDVFVATTPYGELTGASVLNGSLWSLDYEWTCYLIVAALVVLGVLRRAKAVVLLLTAGIVALQVASALDPARLAELAPYFADQRRIELPLIFLWGALLALYAHRVPLDDRLGLLAATVAVTSLLVGGHVLVGCPAIAYLVLWLAVRLPTRLRRIGRATTTRTASTSTASSCSRPWPSSGLTSGATCRTSRSPWSSRQSAPSSAGTSWSSRR